MRTVAWCILLLLQGVQLEFAYEELKALRLQQDLSSLGESTITHRDHRAVDFDRHPIPLAPALDSRPFAERALHVVFSAGVEQLLILGVVLRPPELPLSEFPC